MITRRNFFKRSTQGAAALLGVAMGVKVASAQAVPAWTDWVGGVHNNLDSTFMVTTRDFTYAKFIIVTDCANPDHLGTYIHTGHGHYDHIN